ncbi:MAG: class I SAM-dependent methyltransferase [Ferruginibacter sp.]|nr:class I SAM-dependent methyltransferase [Ferruginibacter sp.]
MSDFEKQYYEADSFWSEGQLMDERNLNRIQTTAGLIPATTNTLLDVGCGNGVFLNWLLDQGTKIKLTGSDRSETALKYVKTNKIQSDIAQLPFEDGSFDCVTCLEVIEHLPVNVYEQALKELVRVSGKYIIISVPYEEKLEEAHTQCPNCRSIFNSDLHFRSFSETVFNNLLNDYGGKNVSSQKLGEYSMFKGHRLYQKLFFPHQLLAWNSPICPLCGYAESGSKPQAGNIAVHKRPNGILSAIKSIPKTVWPKEKKNYWILGLFEKC